MQNSRLTLSRKIFFWLGTLLGVALLTGCDAVTLTNLTPATLPENPSQIYTLTLRVATKGPSTVVPGSVKPHIVIDGQNVAMARSSMGEGIYEYDYRLPPGRNEFAYYFLVEYTLEFADHTEARETYSEINRVAVANRYVLSLETNRGPVGAHISILGRGFSPQDVVYFNQMPVRTVYESPTSLSFFVPALPPARNYEVMLGSAAGNSPVGTFRIDASALSVVPTELNLRSGEMQTLTFTVGNVAPAGGLLLDVTTDVPESVIMPEIVIPAGQNSITVSVQGGKPGQGSLYLKGYDTGEVAIPVAVQAK